ncbi:hypothetical protein [Ligilactobacillus sp. LYQ60]|uniref:hypothetical protein n=1 Tax=Ligilactobacillus sp. LYQ60 TaxID=3378799 RepID=UPI00385191C1
MYITLKDGRLIFEKDKWNDYGIRCVFFVTYEKNENKCKIGYYKLSYVENNKLITADEMNVSGEFEGDAKNSVGVACAFDFYKELRKNLSWQDYDLFFNKINDIFYKRTSSKGMPSYSDFIEGDVENQNIFNWKMWNKTYDVIRNCYLRSDDLKNAFLCKELMEENSKFFDGDFINILSFDDKETQKNDELFQRMVCSDDSGYYNGLKKIMGFERISVNGESSESTFAQEMICVFFLTLCNGPDDSNVNHSDIKELYEIIKKANVQYTVNSTKIVKLISDVSEYIEVSSILDEITNALKMDIRDLEDIQLCTYTKVDNLINIFKHKSLWFTEIHQLNDPLEGRFIEEETLGYVNEKYNTNTYVSSLTDKVDSLNMWNLYGDNGKGVCCIYNNDSFNDDVIRVCYINTDKYRILELIDEIKSLLAVKWGKINKEYIRKNILLTFKRIDIIKSKLNSYIIADYVSGKESKQALERSKQLKKLYKDLLGVKNACLNIEKNDESKRAVGVSSSCCELCESIIKFDTDDVVDIISRHLTRLKNILKIDRRDNEGVYSKTKKEVEEILVGKEIDEEMSTEEVSRCFAETELKFKVGPMLERLSAYFKLDDYEDESEYRIIKNVNNSRDSAEKVKKEDKLRYIYNFGDSPMFDQVILGPKSGEYDYQYPKIKSNAGYQAIDIKDSRLHYR